MSWCYIGFGGGPQKRGDEGRSQDFDKVSVIRESRESEGETEEACRGPSRPNLLGHHTYVR